MARKYNWRSFAEARKFAQSLKSKNSTDWNKYCKSGKRPDDIPSNPHKIYKDEWTTWKYFIGNEFLSFKEARKFVHSLNLEGTNNQKVWNKYCKSGEKPDNIPTTPDRHYKKEWKGSEDWLKKTSVRNSKYTRLPYNQARKYVHSLKISSVRDWEKFCTTGKLPKNIPVLPSRAYNNNEWKGWPDWLGTKKIIERNRDYLSFDQARKYVHSLNFKSRKGWEELSKKKKLPANIPFHPERIYKKEFTTMGDWLGSNTRSNRIISENYLPWIEAKPIYQKLAKKHGLKNGEDWRKFAKTHKKLLEKLNISASPWKSYSKDKVWKRSMKNG